MRKLQVISLRLVPGPKRSPVGYFGRTLEFDLVMMDCQMPELDGYKATQTIRKPASPGWEQALDGSCPSTPSRLTSRLYPDCNAG
jgi:CheY-like chemotaxis protein